MIFGWWRRWRRARLLRRPLDAGWVETLEANFAQWRTLSPEERDQLLAIARVIEAEKAWLGGNGLTVTPAMRRLVSAQAALLLLGHPEHCHYGNLHTVVIYPDGYHLPDGGPSPAGVAGGSRQVLGHARMGGPIVLSWKHALSGARNGQDGRNLVFHEFAHKLDMLDGVVDGTPPIDCSAAARQWFEVMSREYEALRRAVGKGRATLVDAYGATNVAEFFAVGTEHFFEQPIALRGRHPALYAALANFYGQDPAARLGAKAAVRAGQPARPAGKRRGKGGH